MAQKQKKDPDMNLIRMLKHEARAGKSPQSFKLKGFFHRGKKKSVSADVRKADLMIPAPLICRYRIFFLKMNNFEWDVPLKKKKKTTHHNNNKYYAFWRSLGA